MNIFLLFPLDDLVVDLPVLEKDKTMEDFENAQKLKELRDRAVLAEKLVVFEKFFDSNEEPDRNPESNDYIVGKEACEYVATNLRQSHPLYMKMIKYLNKLE